MDGKAAVLVGFADVGAAKIEQHRAETHRFGIALVTHEVVGAGVAKVVFLADEVGVVTCNKGSIHIGFAFCEFVLFPAPLLSDRHLFFAMGEVIGEKVELVVKTFQGSIHA